MSNLLIVPGWWLWRLTLGNPILTSVISQSSRRVGQTWLRTGYMAFLLLVGLLAFQSAVGLAGTSLSRLGQAGQEMFSLVAILQVAIICVVSPIFAAGAISQQRDGRTFPTLLTTPMSNAQIVLGSLLSRVFLIWALLAAGLPVMAMTRLFGRVDNPQIFKATGIAGATALLTGAVAIAWSTLTLGRQRSLMLFYAGVFGYLFVLPVVGGLSAFALPGEYQGSVNWLTPLHPMALLTVLRGVPEAVGNAENWQAPAAEDVRQWGYGWPVDWYLSRPSEAYMVFATGLSMLLVLPGMIWLRSEASAGLGGDGSGGQRWMVQVAAGVRWPFYRVVALLLSPLGSVAEAWTQNAADLATEMRTGVPVRRARSVWHNPIAWREAATASGAGGRGAAKWVFVAAGTMVALLLACRRLATPHTGPAIEDMRTYVGLVVTLEFLIILGVVLNTGASAITREREGETLDLLLTTPMTPTYYIWGKLRGLVSFVLPMVALPSITVLVLAGADVLAAMTSDSAEYVPTVLPESVMLLPMVVVVFCAAAAVLALRASLNSQKSSSAVLKSVLLTVVWLAIFGLIGSIFARVGSGTAFAAVSGGSPVNAVFNLVNPWAAFGDSSASTKPSSLGFPSVTIRIALIIMTGLVTFTYAGGVYVALNALAGNWQAAIRRQQA